MLYVIDVQDNSLRAVVHEVHNITESEATPKDGLKACVALRSLRDLQFIGMYVCSCACGRWRESLHYR